MLKQRHQIFVSLLAAADGAVIAAACYGAWAIRRESVEGFYPLDWESFVKGPMVLFAVPIGLMMLWAFREYRPRRDRAIWGEWWQIAKASVATMAGLVVVLWAVGNDLISPNPETVGYAAAPVHVFGMTLDAGRVQLGALALLLPVMLMAHRTVFRYGLRILRRKGRNLRHVAVIGCGRLGQIVAHTLERNSWTGLRVKYFVSHQDKTRRVTCLDRPVMGGLAQLEDVLEEEKVDAVYVALPSAYSEKMGDILMRLDRFAIDVRVVPDLSPRYLHQSMTVSELDGMPILSYRESPTAGLGGVTKRIIDILGGIVAAIIFMPVMLVAAVLIRLSGPGPVLFKQRRVSLGGEEFNIYKFRTMQHVAQEAGPDPEARWTDRDDPRVTKIGQLLRRTSLDELPQLINVIRGDMSLVGPRPERPELIERFREDWRGYMLRQHVKAGMTGWAQVNGLRGQTCLRKRLQYDLFYIKNWSLLFDVRILLLTVVRGFVHKNAH